MKFKCFRSPAEWKEAFKRHFEWLTVLFLVAVWVLWMLPVVVFATIGGVLTFGFLDVGCVISKAGDAFDIFADKTLGEPK